MPNTLENDIKTNLEEAMPNVTEYANMTNFDFAVPMIYLQHLDEHYLLDYVNDPAVFLTMIMLMIFGCWLLRRWIFRRELPEPHAEPAASRTVTETVMTPEDTATLRKMYEEVMVLREHRLGLEAELMKKQNMLIDVRDEARKWKAKWEVHRMDFQRNLEDYEIYLLPHSSIRHANLDCVYCRTDGNQVIYKCVACRVCSKDFGRPECDFRGDARAVDPPGALQIGDLADANSREAI